MSHIDPRQQHRRAKMLDVARASVSGDRDSGYSNHLHETRRRRRRLLNAPLRTYRGVRCTLAEDCECAACTIDVTHPAVADMDLIRWAKYWCWTDWSFQGIDHNRPGLRMAEKKLAEFDGEFDPWYSWLKRNLPDTVAGRHLLDHIVPWVWCDCWDSKWGNHRGCTCE